MRDILESIFHIVMNSVENNNCLKLSSYGMTLGQVSNRNFINHM